MAAPPGRPDPVALVLFASCVVLGSGNFLAVRFSNLDLPPLWGAGLRFTLATGAFLAIALLTRRPWPRGQSFILGKHVSSGPSLAGRRQRGVPPRRRARVPAMASTTPSRPKGQKYVSGMAELVSAPTA